MDLVADSKSKATREKEGRQASFLAGLIKGMTVAQAAAYAGVNRRTVYDWRDQSQSFRNSWEDAIEESKELTLYTYEEEVKSRALDRDDKTSHLLLMFLVKKLDPSYRDNYKTEHKVVHEKVHEISFSDEEMDQAIDILQKSKSSDQEQKT
jgi:transposase-like protein